MTEEPHATIRASAPRRAIGMVTLLGLGVLLVLLGVTMSTDSLLSRVIMLVFGGLALWAGDRMRRATGREIYLTEKDLRDSTGAVIAALDNIKSVDRGAFAFKPSNGFLLRLRHPASRQWHPGLWWRFGTRVGVGGVTPAAQTKLVAELIQAHLQTET